MTYFARPNLARELAQALSGKTLLSDASNGLFLAAPRRTGKSTFLQHDLLPELEGNGIVVVYVDLWADTSKDPGALIAEKIGEALEKFAGAVAKFAKKAGLESVTVAGALKINTASIGKSTGVTLADALRALHIAAQAPIALVIDEAQHALTSEDGTKAMIALKSARDQMNKPGKVSLMLVMSGSDRDKLLRLVNANNAAFYGSEVTTLPFLDETFTDHISALIEQQRPDLAPVDRHILFEAFTSFGHRPQFFMAAIERALSPLTPKQATSFEHRVYEMARSRQQDDQAQMESDFLGLQPLERVVLWRLLERGHQFKPYDAAALNFYEKHLGKKVTAAQVQRALESLRSRTPSLVWKTERGDYAVDDVKMHSWFSDRSLAGTWPPQA